MVWEPAPAVHAGPDVYSLPTGSAMWEMDAYAARAAQCQQKAKATQSEEEKQSWLAMADSWRQTAELKRVLEQQKVFAFVSTVGVDPAAMMSAATNLPTSHYDDYSVVFN